MKVIMIGTERRLFEEGGTARARVLNYGSLVAELHVIVLSLISDNFQSVQISNKVRLYPTRSKSRLHYFFDALKIGKTLRFKGVDLVSSQDPFESGLVGFLIARLI